MMLQNTETRVTRSHEHDEHDKIVAESQATFHVSNGSDASPNGNAKHYTQRNTTGHKVSANENSGIDNKGIEMTSDITHGEDV